MTAQSATVTRIEERANGRKFATLVLNGKEIANLRTRTRGWELLSTSSYQWNHSCVPETTQVGDTIQVEYVYAGYYQIDRNFYS